MPRKTAPRPPRRLVGPICLTLTCLFLWMALLTFAAGDWPNPSHYPHNAPAQNACGRVGAWTAYQVLYWLGDGAYPLALFGTFASALWLIHGKIVHLLQRAFGLAVLVACTSAAAGLMSGGGPQTLHVGHGGVLGWGLSRFLMDTFAGFGTVLVLLYCFAVGLLFVAEGWVLRLPAAVKRLHEVSGEAVTAARRAVAAVVPAPSPATVAAGPVPVQSAALVEVAEPAAPPAPRPELRINPHRSSPRSETSPRAQSSMGGAESGGAVTGSLFDLPAESPAPVAEAPEESRRESRRSGRKGKDVRVEDEEQPVEGPEAEEEPAVGRDPSLLRAYPTPVGSWNFPPLHLLHEPEHGFSAQQESIVRAKARLLEQTLEEFRLDARVVEIDTGPVITMFELQLGAGIKVSQVASLSNDIARALKAPAVRVVAPIPGKSTVGIEVPNVDKEKVRLKELITMSATRAEKMALPIFIGKDASGAALVTDLATMPHMLIAGTTGSGKSVCINSIIASFLMCKKPDEVKLILVDPKMVEMSQFKEVPHLMAPIVTDMNRAEQILDWAVTKMDERYELLAEARVRNIGRYNRLTEDEIVERFQPATDEERAQIPTRMPYIVIIIDELADLMMTCAKEVEHHLARLAQKSRAVGVHIVVATQRPEAKVVTGLIKSNMPCRIAFRVASRMDSRIVLDQNGAEVLMGQGDMLFLPPGSAKLVRAQGTLLEDDELHRVIEFLTLQSRPEFHPQLMRLKPKGLSEDGERDPLFDQAVRIILESQRGSVSLLQRRLTVGYSRASRLIDQMAEVGVVGEFKGSQAREVLMTLEEWEDEQDERPAGQRSAAVGERREGGAASLNRSGAAADADEFDAEAEDEAEDLDEALDDAADPAGSAPTPSPAARNAAEGRDDTADEP